MEIGDDDTRLSVDDDGNDEDSDLELEDLGLTNEAIETALASSRFADDSPTSSLSSSRRTSIASSPPLDSDEEEDTNSGLADFVTGPITSLRSPQVSDNVTSNALSGFSIPPAPPLPTFSLVPPPATVSVRPTFNYANIDSLDDTSDDESEGEDPAGASENSTAVTRFLINVESFFCFLFVGAGGGVCFFVF